MQTLSITTPSSRPLAIRRALTAIGLAALACLFVSPFAVSAETVTLDKGITLDFPATPMPVAPPENGFELIRAADATSPAHGYTALKMDLPAWLRWTLQIAPDLAAEMTEGGFTGITMKSLPGAYVTDEASFTLNGYRGVELQVENITAVGGNPLKKDFNQLRGRLLLVDDAIYIYCVIDDAANPASDEDVSVFLDSLQITHARAPGDPDRQMQVLGYWIMGALLLGLLLLVASVVGLVMAIRKLRKRKQRRAEATPSA